MSTLDARTAATPDREPRPRVRLAGTPASKRVRLSIGWTWSRRAASRTLGFELRKDVEVVLSVTIRETAESGPDEVAVEGIAECELRCGGAAVDADVAPPRPRRLVGTWFESDGFRHLDLRDERGVFLRASLSILHAGHSAIWTRLPEELQIAGGCHSAPAIEFTQGDDAASTSCSCHGRAAS